MFRKVVAPLLLAFFAVSANAQQASEKIDDAMNAKIRAEGTDRSKIMWIEHYLADVYGPRPVGSPNHVAAAKWAVKTMTDFGMQNAHLEPFTWRGVGWLPGRATGFITAPVKANIKFEAQPWSPFNEGHREWQRGEYCWSGESDGNRTHGVSHWRCDESERRHCDGGRAASSAG